ncbi:MAG TPA: protein kinase [Gemmatimonadaceae bacterium]|nr:protein kinase [Gemmatimonadaceae bacterium]
MDLRQQLQQTLGAMYALERELGGGGMSRVFVADERRLNRKVVIKVVSPELSQGLSGERFEREIQLAASLQQANIVPILAAGETNGLPFYTMPFVEGESLRARLASGALPVSMIVSVLRDVAKALAYAHDRGVVHRDIKPDNVLLSGGTAVVTDFGIAKAITNARKQQDGATLTQLGTSIGTPAYMAPEQAAGDPNVDHRADIYSLGCMAYELLTGQTPFHGRTPARMLAAHMTETPAPISELRPDTPPLLDQLVLRCLEKDPAARPQSGRDIVQALESITSGSLASMPGALIGGAPTLMRSLGTYAAAFVGVALVARASVIALSVPDWVFPGAIALMLLGLPVVLFTWFVGKTARRVAVATPALTPGGSAAPPGTMATLAVKASPHVTWRRAWMGGAVALGAFALVVASVVTLRAMGIGPEGSLRAAGKLGDKERLIVTEFQAPDTSLSTLVAEAVRTNLGQSRVVSIMPPTAIVGALQRMQRPAGSRLDLQLARDIAQREGVKAVVDGAIRKIGDGYVVSLRLVSVDSANELATFQETANNTAELLKAIDQLTRKLRGRIGESLKDVRGSPALEQVTTPSLEALRIYAEAARSIDRGGNPIAGADRLREAVRLDTTFAMAWRKLGVAYNNAGMPRARSDTAFEKAYQFRNRLTERERLLTEGSYFQMGPGRDRRRAITAYQALLAIDPTDGGATNNLGSIYMGRRDFARAESLYRAGIATGRATSQQYTNFIGVLYNGGKLDEAAKYVDEYRQRFPTALAATTLPLNFFYQRSQFDSMEAVLQTMAKSNTDVVRMQGLSGLSGYRVLRGRIDDGVRYGREAQRLAQTIGAPPGNALSDSLDASWRDLILFADTARAVRRLEAELRRTDIGALPLTQRPYNGLAMFFAVAGNVQRAHAFLAQDRAEYKDSVERRLREPGWHAVQGIIARSERNYPEAIRELWLADSTYDGPNGNCAICILDDIGWTWVQAGVADSAIYYFEKYLNTPYLGRQGFEGAQRPLMLKQLAELYEAKGDTTDAAKRYREFIALWERADASLQPRVADARRRLARLADAEGRK